MKSSGLSPRLSGSAKTNVSFCSNSAVNVSGNGSAWHGARAGTRLCYCATVVMTMHNKTWPLFRSTAQQRTRMSGSLREWA
eukprot:6183503-Pleurochrysis_carterae.AAC.3